MKSDIAQGIRFQVCHEVEAQALTEWSAAFTGGFTCNLPKGTIIEVMSDPVSHAIGFTCKPLNYESFEKQWVPEEDRIHPKYRGFYLVVNKETIGRELIKC